MPFRTQKTKVYQYDIIVRGSRFRGSCGTENFEEAKAVEAHVRSAAKSQRNKGGAYTLSEALGTYHRDKIIGTPSEATNKSQARAILKHMEGRQQLANMTNAHVMAYVAKDRATCTNATVNRRLQMLGRAIRHMGKIYKADIPDLELKSAETKEPKERIRELSQSEQSRLLQALPAEYVAFVSFALMTGARIETIASLRWSDVHLDRDEMTFHLKGDDVMTFPVNSEIKALLSALPRSNVEEHKNRVFVRLDRQTLDRVPIVSSGGVFGTAWRFALVEASVADFRFHDLRHTYATRLLRMTNNLKLVSEMLGHKDIATTMRYAHVMMDDKRAAMDQFSMFAGAEKQTTPRIAPRLKTGGKQ